MTFAVIDLETLSTRPDAVVTAIGIGLDDGGVYYYPLHWGDQVDRHVDQATVAWWMRQPDDARRLTHIPPDDSAGWSTVDALRDAGAILSSVGHVYGDPPSFDLGILRSLYAHFDLPIPWSHRIERCCRTLRNGRAREHFPEILHHAGHDALAAALNVKGWLT